MYDFNKIIENELSNLSYLIETTENKVDTNLNGTIRSKSRKGGVYYERCWYENGQRKFEYIGTPSDKRVIAFKRNRFNIKRLEVLKRDRALLKNMQGKYQDYSPSAVHAKLPSSYKDLPGECYVDERFEELKSWARVRYDKNSWPMTEHATTACDGTQVRSKGECIWYDSLKRAGIPFRYDPVIKLRDANGFVKRKSPDFEILCISGRLLYVEHLGMLLRPEYLEDFKEKVRLYMLNGIVIGDNLIITSDSKDGGINSQMINEIINKIIKPLVFGQR